MSRRGIAAFTALTFSIAACTSPEQQPQAAIEITTPGEEDLVPNTVTTTIVAALNAATAELDVYVELFTVVEDAEPEEGLPLWTLAAIVTNRDGAVATAEQARAVAVDDPNDPADISLSNPEISASMQQRADEVAAAAQELAVQTDPDGAEGELAIEYDYILAVQAAMKEGRAHVDAENVEGALESIAQVELIVADMGLELAEAEALLAAARALLADANGAYDVQLAGFYGAVEEDMRRQAEEAERQRIADEEAARRAANQARPPTGSGGGTTGGSQQPPVTNPRPPGSGNDGDDINNGGQGGTGNNTCRVVTTIDENGFHNIRHVCD